MASNYPVIAIEVRRAIVAEAVARRTPYRQIAEELGVSFGTVAGDVTALRKEWRKSYGELGGIFTQTAIDLDRWQARVERNLDSLAADELPPAISALVRISDQRNKLFGLYPRPGTEAEEPPTGPIKITFEIIEPGNSRLVENSQELEDDDAEEDIEAVVRGEYQTVSEARAMRERNQP